MKDNESFACRLTRRELLEIDACTQCGECLKFCPVQMVTDDPSISPPEKIRIFREFLKATDSLKATLTGPGEIDRKLLEHFTKAVYECTTCGACGEACPVGIHTQRLWPMLRREMVIRGLGPLGAHGEMPDHMRETGNIYGKPAAERFSPWFPEGVKPVENAEVAYYAGCTGAYEAQPMVRGDALVLGAIGEPFTMLEPTALEDGEICCGFPLFITGQHDMLEEIVKKLVDAYKKRGVKTIVCSCPCCVNIMSREWPLYYAKATGVEDFPLKIKHITQFAADALKSGKLKIKKSLDERLIYHDPCYLSRGVGIMDEPREVLRSIPGATVLEFEKNRMDSQCCGAGGAARKTFHENAVAMGRLTIDEAVEKGADRLILSCPACYAKVNEAMQGYEKQVKITDIMELLAELL